MQTQTAVASELPQLTTSEGTLGKEDDPYRSNKSNDEVVNKAQGRAPRDTEIDYRTKLLETM